MQGRETLHLQKLKSDWKNQVTGQQNMIDYHIWKEMMISLELMTTDNSLGDC